MITRKQLIALIAFVLFGSFILWLGREEPSTNVDRAKPPQTPAVQSATPPSSGDTVPAPDKSPENSAEPPSKSGQSSRKASSEESAGTPGKLAARTAPGDFEFPAGPSRELFLSKCTVCHSLRYISMQPDFSKAYWEKEVAKMINVYRAHITETEAAEIVDYLSSIKK